MREKNIEEGVYGEYFKIFLLQFRVITRDLKLQIQINFNLIPSENTRLNQV